MSQRFARCSVGRASASLPSGTRTDCATLVASVLLQTTSESVHVPRTHCCDRSIADAPCSRHSGHCATRITYGPRCSNCGDAWQLTCATSCMRWPRVHFGSRTTRSDMPGGGGDAGDAGRTQPDGEDVVAGDDAVRGVEALKGAVEAGDAGAAGPAGSVTVGTAGTAAG
jgi:hypothetical protein